MANYIDDAGHEYERPLVDVGEPRPAGPDPARDTRVTAYHDRERRRAVRALDRYIEVMNGPDLDASATRAVAGDRFIEAVGDYVLARLGETDLNARAYGWEVGRGAPMAAAMESSPDNPFYSPAAGDAGDLYGDTTGGAPAPVTAATDGATMPHATCADVSRLNEPLGSRWACTAACPR